MQIIISGAVSLGWEFLHSRAISGKQGLTIYQRIFTSCVNGRLWYLWNVYSSMRWEWDLINGNKAILVSRFLNGSGVEGSAIVPCGQQTWAWSWPAFGAWLSPCDCAGFLWGLQFLQHPKKMVGRLSFVSLSKIIYV